MAPPPPGGTLAVFHLAERSGPSRSLANELAWLAGGGPVHVVVPGIGQTAGEYADFAHVSTGDYSALMLPHASREIVAFCLQLAADVRFFRERIRETKPARVVVVTASLPAVLLAARAERVPTVVYAAEVVPARPGVVRRVGAAAIRRLVRKRADAIVCCSRFVAGQYAGPGAPPTTVAYPPIGHEFTGGDGAGLRQRLGIEPYAPCVGAVGALSRGKGQDVLVRALPTLREHLPGLCLILAGAAHPRTVDVEFRDELVARAQELGVGDSVFFAEQIEPVADLYAAVDVVANPARREGFGRVGPEALVAGRPVVASRVEAIPEVLRDGVDALLVPPDDPAALASALIRVLDDRTLAERLVASGAERVRREFTELGSLRSFALAVSRLPAPVANPG